MEPEVEVFSPAATPTAAGSGSPPTVESLQAELVAVKEKFAQWKVKAKNGVDQQRKQIKELTATQEEYKQQIVDQQHNFVKLGSTAMLSSFELCTASALEVHEKCFRLSAVAAPIVSFEGMGERSESPAALGAIADKSELDALTAKFDKYKRQSQQALKITSNDLETARREADELCANMEEKDLLIVELRNTADQRERAMDTLAEQLQESMNTVQELQQELAATADQRQAQRSDLLLQAEELQREFEQMWQQREQQMIDAHKEEVSQLNQQHEEELEMATDMSMSPVPRGMDVSPQSKFVDPTPQAVSMEDEAYEALLEEVDALRKEATAYKTENVALKEKVKALEQQCKLVDKQDSTASVVELQRQLQQQRDQVWTLNQQLLEAKAQSQSNPHNTDAQQKTYLRSIFVQFACAKTEAVSGKLMPVLTSLLELRDEELRAIYTAHPSWLS